MSILVEIKPTKKIGGPNLGQTGQNWFQNLFFYHFLKFGSLVFKLHRMISWKNVKLLVEVKPTIKV